MPSSKKAKAASQSTALSAALEKKKWALLEGTMASGPAPGSHLTRVPDSERSLTLEVPAPKGSKATAVQKKKWAERTIVAMSKYDGFDMIRQEMAAQELAEMAASGDEGRTAVYEAGAIAPLVDLLRRGTALAKRWAAAALCAIAELRDRNKADQLFH